MCVVTSLRGSLVSITIVDLLVLMRVGTGSISSRSSISSPKINAVNHLRVDDVQCVWKHEVLATKAAEISL